MHNLLKLNLNEDYIIEDVDQIQTWNSNKGENTLVKFYVLSVLLRKKGDSEKELIKKFINIQFAKNLHIGAIYSKFKESIPEHWQLRELPLSFLKTSNLVDGKSKQLERKKYLKYDNQINSRICVYEFKNSILLNGQKINFISFPSFEIARYFLFSWNKYNESLLNSEFTNDPKKNKIYNLEKSGNLTNEKGEKRHYLQLRKKIADESVQQAGDLAFNDDFRRIVKQLIDTVNSKNGYKNYSSFFTMRIPNINFSKFEVLGHYTTNLNNLNGFEVKVITSVQGYSQPIFYARDNDGRRTEQYDINLPNVGFGHKPLKPKPNLNDITDNDINHDEVGDPEIEQENLIYESDFDKYSEKSINVKINKNTQEFQNGNYKPIDPKDKIGVSGVSSEGGRGSGYQGINNIPDSRIYITPQTYWLNFQETINAIKNNWENCEINFLIKSENTYKFSDKMLSLTMNFKVSGIFQKVHYYFVQIKIMEKEIYLIEFDQNQTKNSTILFWNKKFKKFIGLGNIKLLIDKLQSKNGKQSAISNVKLINSNYQIYGISQINHPYLVRNSENKFYTIKVALNFYNSNIIAKIEDFLNL